MPTNTQTLHAEILGEERAIRNLIGEEKALKSKIQREHAQLKLNEHKLQLIVANNRHPVVGRGGSIPHGDRFPDFSSYQPTIDLSAVRHAGSVKVGLLAFTKVTEGTGWIDSYGEARLHSMSALGFPHRGAYHFLHPSESPVAQAEHMLNVLSKVTLTASDILCCDAEVSDGESGRVVQSCVAEFGATLRKHTPCKLWLYGGGPFFREYGVQLSPYDGHWLAAYTGDPSPYMVFGRAHTIAWQYSDGRYGPVPRYCPGVGSCDMSIIL